MKLKILAAAVLVMSGYGIGRASQPAAPAHIYELRTYTAAEGKLDAVNARFRDNTRRIFDRHNMKSVGYWLPTEGDKAGTTLIYILEHPSREEARKNWAEFSADPEWQKVKAESEKDGRIVAKAESVFMSATDYSPIK
ncbi:MAG TPA: NIPSNAP family protein [Vicinamibacterales bacterium]|nr:NIPSNAP family protein [Vicinamibacterales bacterium]